MNENTYFINPFLPENLKYYRSHEGYSIYENKVNKKLYIDILKKKKPQPKSYFWEVTSMNEASELIELLSNPVRD